MMSRIFIITLTLLIVVGLGAHFVSEAAMGAVEGLDAGVYQAGAEGLTSENNKASCNSLHGSFALPVPPTVSVSSVISQELTGLDASLPLSFSLPPFHPPRFETPSLPG